MTLRTQTGLLFDVEANGRFVMVGIEATDRTIGANGDYIAVTNRDAIELARALLISAGIVPTPQACGYESFGLPPDDTAIGAVPRG